MRRIVILGGAGSGKSTLARRLGAVLDLPVTHLDVLFWRPGWAEPDDAGFRARVAESVSGDGWISEGNYSSKTFDLRIPRADTVIWLDPPRLTRLRRVLWRTLFEQRRADLAEGCHENVLRGDFPEFLYFTWAFDRLGRPRLEANLADYPPVARVERLTGARSVAAFLRSIEAEARS